MHYITTNVRGLQELRLPACGWMIAWLYDRVIVTACAVSSYRKPVLTKLFPVPVT